MEELLLTYIIEYYIYIVHENIKDKINRNEL